MPAARAIQAATCKHFGINQGDLVGTRRQRALVRARHLAMFLCRQRLGLSYPELGIAFGNRDHTTILSACERARERLALEPGMRDHLRSVETLLVASTAAASLGTAMPVDRATQMSKGAAEHLLPAAPEGWTNERLGQEPASAPPAALGGAHLAAEVRRLTALLNTPQTVDWVESVRLEAAHQRERWGSDHDAGKSPADWFWLLGYLSGKALAAAVAGNTEKALHHTISAGAVLANWHLALSGADTRMRPGIVEPT